MLLTPSAHFCQFYSYILVSCVRFLFFLSIVLFYCFFFFFQAEDGIRDWSVTGVQTCALPIFRTRPCHPFPSGAAGSWRTARRRASRRAARRRTSAARQGRARGPRAARSARSEERRVGKECRSRWSAEH